MSDKGKQTVRELLASVREWAADIDEMIMTIGHDHWPDINIEDFKRIGESADIIPLLQLWGEMAATRMQIASLPECDK